MSRFEIIAAGSDLCQFIFGKKFENQLEDPFLWIGIIIAIIGLCFLLWLVKNGVALRPDGWAYDNEYFLFLVTIGFAIYRVGANFIMLNAANYLRDEENTKLFYFQVLLPVVVITLEKSVFLFSMNRGQWADRHFIKKDQTESEPVDAISVYERFETDKTFKLVITAFTQWGLLLFYLGALQLRLGDMSKHCYVYWLVSFGVQEVSDMTGVFGSNFHYPWWAFMLDNCTEVTLIRTDDGSNARLTPGRLAIYMNFFFAWVFEMFGRCLLVHTLPLFLMFSEDPIDYVLNCVATGFFLTLSQATVAQYKFTLEPVYDGESSDSEFKTLSDVS